MWVLDKKACEELGLTKGQIKSKVQRGIWTRGQHFLVEDRQTWINLEEVQKWVQGNCQEG